MFKNQYYYKFNKYYVNHSAIGEMSSRNITNTVEDANLETWSFALYGIFYAL